MNATLSGRILADDFSDVCVLVNGRMGKIVGASGKFEVTDVNVRLEDGTVVTVSADDVEEVSQHA